MPNNRNLQDASLTVTHAMPASTAAVSTAGINLSTTLKGDFVAGVDFEVDAPALSTAQLPDTKVMTYTVETAAPSDSAFGTPTVLYTLGAQTGAAGAGSAAATYNFRLPSGTQGFVRVKVTPSASGTGDASATSVTLKPKF